MHTVPEMQYDVPMSMRILCCSFVDAVQMPEGIYPEGMTTLYPIETWSDDFTMAISGIPSMVNDFSGGPFMENYYHSQYDNQDVYEEEVYRFHHEFYLKLLLGY